MKKKAWLEMMDAGVRDALNRLQVDMVALHESRQADTKSSAGDKHETARAMVDQELQQLNQQRKKALRNQSELQQLTDAPCEAAARGAAVETEHIIYYISISFGKLPVEGTKPVYALSPVSPAAQAMLGKRAREVFEINGAKHVILAVY
ncbi:MAG: 3-oxoacyl-ACP synthase [Flavobacteriales bacterium]|jgi:hypothetical protein|nr:3-oxoacyl-ACP synthase [Flavobacteriales bacterium]